MAKKNSETQEERKEPIFHRSIERRYVDGEFKSSTSVDVSEWEMGGKKGLTCKLSVNKGIRKFVNFDPLDPEVKEMILDMFAQAESYKQ